MKVKILAVIAFISVIAAIIANTIIINAQIGHLYERIENIDVSDENALNAAQAAYEHYKKREAYISLTVNHDDLTNIEDAFAELIGYLSIDMNEDAFVTKNRLLCYVEHLRRLSGINIDAII
jgi:predicted PurR-regulated permease PerM